MKKAILLVSFGTSYREAGENSLRAIWKEIQGAGNGIPVYQAYTSEVIIHKLAGEGIKIWSVEETLKEILDQGVEDVYVVSTHMIPGMEYEKMRSCLERYRGRFKRLKVSASVLEKEEDCDRLVPVIRDILQIRAQWEYVLMGHGTEAEANIRYTQMNEAFRKAGLFNVRIASVEAKPDIEDAIYDLSLKEHVQKVILHPFMIVAGDHAQNDMAGGENSYLTELTKAGFQVEVIIKGLGEYPQFRKMFADKLEELMQ